MRKIFVFILMGFALVMNHQISAKEKTGKEYHVYVDEIIHSFEQEMVEEYGFVAESSGGNMPRGGEEISVGFKVFQRTSLQQARELQVALTEKLLKKVNEHKALRPFLKEYPFPVNRVDIMLTFKDPGNQYYIDGSIAFTFHAKGKVFFYDAKANYNEKKKKNIHNIGKEPICEESYEELFEKVDQSTFVNNMPVTKSNPPENLTENYDDFFGQDTQETLTKQIRQLDKKFGFYRSKKE